MSVHVPPVGDPALGWVPCTSARQDDGKELGPLADSTDPSAGRGGFLAGHTDIARRDLEETSDPITTRASDASHVSLDGVA